MCPVPHPVSHAGAGAYVCGESSALLESIEGKPGRPRQKPPRLSTKGMHLMTAGLLCLCAEAINGMPMLSTDAGSSVLPCPRL